MKDFPGLAAAASAAENGQPIEQLSQPLQQQLMQFSESHQFAADGSSTPPDGTPAPALPVQQQQQQQQQDTAVQQQPPQQQQQQHPATPTTEPSETTATPAEVTPAAAAPARVRWSEHSPSEQQTAGSAATISPCAFTDFRLKENKQFGEWKESKAAQASFARWQELEEQQLQRQQRAATGAAAADQAFNEWCQQQQQRCPSPAGDRERHNRAASSSQQQLQPPGSNSCSHQTSSRTSWPPKLQQPRHATRARAKATRRGCPTPGRPPPGTSHGQTPGRLATAQGRACAIAIAAPTTARLRGRPRPSTRAHAPPAVPVRVQSSYPDGSRALHE